MPGLHIGIKAEKTRQPRDENQMEVGKSPLAGIQPLQRIKYIGKERAASRLVFQHPAQEFGQEQSDGRLIRVVRQRLVSIIEPHIPYALQSRLLPVVEIYLQNGKRPKEHTFEGRLTRFWQLYHERHRPTYGRIDIHNQRIVVVF